MRFTDDLTISTYFEGIPMDTPLMKTAKDFYDDYNYNMEALGKNNLRCSFLDAFSAVISFISESQGTEDLGTISDTLCREVVYDLIEKKVSDAKENIPQSFIEDLAWEIIRRRDPELRDDETFDIDEYIDINCFDTYIAVIDKLICRDATRVTYTNLLLYGSRLIDFIVDEVERIRW
jgi:hypothetical protein